jgi:hypothetical protein
MAIAPGGRLLLSIESLNQAARQCQEQGRPLAASGGFGGSPWDDGVRQIHIFVRIGWKQVLLNVLQQCLK